MWSKDRMLVAFLTFCIGVSGGTTVLARERENDDRRNDDPPAQRQVEKRTTEVQQERNVREDDAPPANGDQQQKARQPRKAKSILGSKVSIRGDIAIGTVDDIVFDDEGYIDYLVVINDGKQVIVPWEAARFTFEKKSQKATATVDITRERLREAPTITQDKFSTIYEPTYRQRVYRFYGIQPRAQRRSILPFGG